MPFCRLLLPVLSVLVLAAPARAAEVVIGSDLTADATITYADPNDWAAWNTSLASGGLVQSPVQGEINVVNLKGRIIPEGRAQAAPDLAMHVAILRPQADGSVVLVQGFVSEDLPLPFGGDPNAVHTYTRSTLTKPDGADGKGGTRLCIQKGDYIALAPNGGFGGYAQDNPEQIYANGAQFQVFGATRSSSSVFNKGGAFDSSPFRGTSQAGRELLMNATIGTRENARYTCRTKAEQGENLDAVTPAPDPYAVPTPAPPAVGVAKLVKPKKAPKVTRRKRVKITIRCSATGPCSGRLGLRTYAKAKPFKLSVGKTASVTLVLNKKATKKLKRKGAKLTVKAMLANTAGPKSTLRFRIRR